MTFEELNIGDEFGYVESLDCCYMKTAPNQYTLDRLHSKFFLNLVVINGPNKGEMRFCDPDIQVIKGSK